LGTAIGAVKTKERLLAAEGLLKNEFVAFHASFRDRLRKEASLLDRVLHGLLKRA